MSSVRKQGYSLLLSPIFTQLFLFFPPPTSPSSQEITVHHLSQQDRFLVAATDGLWNLMSNEEVVDFVQAGLMPKCGSGRGLPSPKRITKVAQSLLEHAVKKRAHDDVTVVIIVFDTAKM
mmetsp:Transcript_24441/g.61856  ORF Transcript_24441/g.61856 Transcript_24441/m.61856 type:complete len:120 (+) Transcript_24441:1440-1799(+)